MAFIKAQELVLSKEKQDKAFCDTFIYEPENIQEKSLGNLYIVGEITDFSRGSNYLINLLVSVIKKEYYSDSKRTPLEAMEAGLHRANLALSDFIEEGNDDWIGNLNMICACFKDGELHFSITGDARVFLIRSDEMIDLGRNLVSFDQKTQPLKTFANIASGSLEQGDKLILSTPEIFRITSAGTIKETMSQFSLSGAAEKFKKSLDSAGNISVSGILFLEMAEEAEKENIEVLPHIKINPEKISESNQEFIAENEPLRLDEIIGQASLPACNASIARHPDGSQGGERSDAGGESEFFEKDSSSDNLLENELKQEQEQEQEIIRSKKELILNNLSKISGYLKKALIFLKRISGKAFGFIKNSFSSIAEKAKKKTEKPSEEIYKSGEEKTKETENKEIKIPSINLKKTAKNLIEFPKTYKKLPKSSRALLGASLVLIILLFASVFLLSQKRDYEIKFTHYSGILAEAHQKEDEAEAALIYKDEKKARELLKQAKELTAQILESKYLKKEAEELSALINEQVELVDHIVLLPEIYPLINFQEINQGAALSEIEITEGNLYSFDPSDNVIYEFDLENKEARIALADSNGIGHLQKSAVLKDSRIVFLTDSPGAASFDSVSETLKEQKIVFAENEKKFQDVSSYSNNIYLLDIENSQIWKHSGILAGFSNGKEWIKPGEEREFGNAVSLSIDGAIWILKSDGNVLKYVSGHKRDFKLGGLITSLNHPVKIFTAPHLKNLYILDPNNRRALVFNKKGEIASQFVSEKFNNLKDFTVSDDERKIYLLNGTEVFEVEM